MKSRHRKPVCVSIAPDVQQAIAAKADEVGLPFSRVFDHIARRQFGLPMPAEQNVFDAADPKTAA
jgi:hypothetical protein